jgi:hypothetical protein
MIIAHFACNQLYSVHSMKAQMGAQRYSSNHSEPRRLIGVGGQSQAPAALPPRKSPDTHYAGGWVGPRADQNVNGEEKIL